MSGSDKLSSSSSSSFKAKTSPVPIGWEWVLNICSEARLPELGRPVNWDRTAKVHEKILIDPDNGKAFDPLTGKPLSSAVGFIKATKGVDPMPGSLAPAAARVELYSKPEMQNSILLDNDAHYLVPCIVHGDYVKVESLQVDHLQAKENIRKRQDDLVRLLNNNAEFAEYLLKQPGMEKFFIKHTKDGKYYGTLFFYEVYFNDIDNLWLICGACNLHKSNQDTLEWLKNQWLYGKEFLDYLRLKRDDQGILKKTQDEQGLAEVAISWFWERHANYISTAKALLEHLTIPIQILNKKLDHVVGEDNQERAIRLKASLDAIVTLASKVVESKVGMPKSGEESDHTSSDSERRLTPPIDDDGQPVNVSSAAYNRAVEETSKQLPVVLKQLLKEKVREEALEERKDKGSKISRKYK